MMLTIKDGHFFDLKKNQPLSVSAKHVRGRWQYRMESGKLIASGVSPSEFARTFWHRDDFMENVT